MPLFILGCGENTTTPIIPEISKIVIDQAAGGPMALYPTDLNNTISLTASAHYDDGTTQEVTNNVLWMTDLNATTGYNSLVTLAYGSLTPIKNGGDADIALSYKTLQVESNASIHVHKLLSINYENVTVTTGALQNIKFFGTFDNNETNRTLPRNITFYADANATVSLADDNVSIDINITSLPTTITATLFDGSVYAQDFNKTFQ